MGTRGFWILILAVAAMSLGCGPDQATAWRGPPPTPRDEVVEVVHGREIVDPYRWLEPGDDPDVARWVHSQDVHARAVLEASPHRAGLVAALRKRWDREGIVVPVQKRGARYFYGRRHRGRDKVVYYVREGIDGRERVLLDPATLSSDGSIAVQGIFPGPRGERVVYRASRNNADSAWFRVRDVQSGEDLEHETIPGARFAWPDWANDGRSFYYTGLPDDPSIPPSKLAGHATVRRHVLGQPAKHDEVLFGPTGDARTVLAPRLSASGRYLLVHVFHGSAGPTDIYFEDLEGGTAFVPLQVGGEHPSAAFGSGGRLYLLTSDGAPRYRVMEIDPHRPARPDWRELVPQRRQTLQSVALMNGHLVLSYLDDVNGRVEVRRLDDGRSWWADLPAMGAVMGIWSDAGSDEALIAFGSLARPPTIFRVPIPGDTLATADAKVFWAPADDDIAPTVMRQVFVASADGTRIPVFVAHRADLELDGRRPTILYGYGGFGISITPAYNPIAEVWMARGGVWAQASLRGGGEYGEQWHRAGTRHNKQRVFDDFLAASEYLVDAGFTSPPQLGIMGGSNGGLLVGAAATQRPELFGAVVCKVPLLDMVRYHRFGLGELWIDEYGSSRDRHEFRSLHAYSPYHRIRDGVRYPPFLMMSADTDDRVDPLHARKFVASMQHATGWSAPVLLRTEAQAGHGGADSLRQRIDAIADELSFLLGQLAPGYGAG